MFFGNLTRCNHGSPLPGSSSWSCTEVHIQPRYLLLARHGRLYGDVHNRMRICNPHVRYASPKLISALTLSFWLHREGMSLRLTGDRDRQRFMAGVSMLAAFFGLLGNGYNLGAYGSTVAHSVFSFFFNWLVQVRIAVQNLAVE